MMHFAVVAFPQENDALGVIPTNWILPAGKSCFHPTLTSDFTKNKMIFTRQEPKSDWKEFQIKILKKYESYETAKSHLIDAEVTSNIDSECEMPESRKRLRKERTIMLPGENESSGSEEDIGPNKKFKPLPKFLEPPSIPASSDLSHSPRTPHSNHTPPPSQHHEFHTTQHTLYKHTPQTPNFGTPLLIQVSPTTSTKSTISPPPQYLEEVDGPQTTNFSQNLIPLLASNSGCSNTNCKQNQQLVWEVLRGLSAKLDSMMAILKKIETTTRAPNHDVGNENQGFDDWSPANFPLSPQNFLEFEEKLKEVSFRQKMMKIMINLSGDNVKSFTMNIMRKLLSNELAEEYSLTGKVTTRPMKKTFTKTNTFLLVSETCFKKFKEGDEAKLREGVSDWLMQAKFRRLRREKKKTIQSKVKQIKGNPATVL